MPSHLSNTLRTEVGSLSSSDWLTEESDDLSQAYYNYDEKEELEIDLVLE